MQTPVTHGVGALPRSWDGCRPINLGGLRKSRPESRYMLRPKVIGAQSHKCRAQS